MKSSKKISRNPVKYLSAATDKKIFRFSAPIEASIEKRKRRNNFNVSPFSENLISILLNLSYRHKSLRRRDDDAARFFLRYGEQLRFFDF